MAYARIGRKRIYYETRGQGQALLLLMGWQGDRRWWPESLLSRLEKHFLLILMDHRGTGRSKDQLGLYSIKGLARDAVAVLDDFGLSSVSVLGVSMGGMVAQAMAIHHPERVNKLILTSSSAKVGLLGGLNKTQQSAWFNYLKKPNKGLQAFLLDLLFSRPAVRDDKAECEDDLLVKHFKQRIGQHRASLRTVMKQFLAVQHFDSRASLNTFTKPSLIVTGDNDLIIGSHHSEVLHHILPNAKLHYVKDGSHAMLDAKSEELAQVYHDFLKD